MTEPRRPKAISVRQPWAYLIITGQKTMELRTFPFDYIGTLVIHASKTVDQHAMAYFGLQGVSLPSGAALGVVVLDEVVDLDRQQLERRRHEHRMWGPYLYGRVGLILSSPKPFSVPVDMPGQRGLFHVPDDVLP